MDKYELKVSLDEIDSLISERRFSEAADVADTIDWTRVRGVHVLCRISDLYKINKRYKDSRDLMEMAYERNPSGRKIIYSLCELELKLNNYIHALQLYNAFINAAPRDPDRYLLQYKLYKKQDVNVLEQIYVLEEFLQHDFRERWAYELATLYLKAGEDQRCISQCDEIVAYFGDGRFVIRALELKKSLTPLTPQQEERLEILRSGGTIAPPAPASAEDETEGETVGAEASGHAIAPGDAGESGHAETGGDAGESGHAKAPGDVGESGRAKAPGDAGLDAAAEAEEDPDSAGPAATPEEYTENLLSDVKMEETIARGMREIGDYDEVLAQETSGQMAMVMEEEPAEESQVEGQLDLAQIMSEWEKIRRDSEMERLAQARRRILERSDEARRELYGDHYASGAASMNGSAPERNGTAGPETDPASGIGTGFREAENAPADPKPGAGAGKGSTRSWKKEDVEEGLRRRR